MQHQTDGPASLGDTASRLRDEGTILSLEMNGAAETQQGGGDHDDDGGEWQMVENSKRQKKDNNYPSISHASHVRLHSSVKVTDLQNLTLYFLADGPAPQWCAVKHHRAVHKVVVLLVPGLEFGMFNGSIPLPGSHEEALTDNVTNTATDSPEQETSNGTNIQTSSSQSILPRNPKPDDYYPTKLTRNQLAEPLQPLSDIFEHVWRVQTSGDSKYSKTYSPVAGILTAPIPKANGERKSKGVRPPREARNWKNERTSITELLATTQELIDEGFMLHPAQYRDSPLAVEEEGRRMANHATAADGWLDTPGIHTIESGTVPDSGVEAGSVLAGKRVLAMDCEMCATSPPGVTPQVSSLTRISIVDWEGKTVLDEYVMPSEPITDYLTPYSGITAKTLEGVTTSLADIQKKLMNDLLTPQTILVGHSLESDLTALKLTHPFIVDTSLIYPHPRGPPLKSSLKFLANKYLERAIQQGHGSTGHDSVEDAHACLDLVKQKCERGKIWGTSDASAESIFKRLARHPRPAPDKRNPAGPEEFRQGAVVDWGDPKRGYGASARVAIACDDDAAVAAGVQRCVLGDDADDDAPALVPRGGVDFVFARLRALEAHQGWWTHSGPAGPTADPTATPPSPAALATSVRATVAHVAHVWDALPPRTALLVYSGGSDPRPLADLQVLQRRFRDEFRVRKWDELEVRWTDVEEQRLRSACARARSGIGFVAVK